MIHLMIIIMAISTIASLILIIRSFYFILNFRNIKYGIPIFFLGLVISGDVSIRLIGDLTLNPTFWGIEAFFTSIVMAWIAIVLGGERK